MTREREKWAGCSECLSGPNQKNQSYLPHLHMPRNHSRGGSGTAFHQASNQKFEGFVQNCQLLHDRDIHTSHAQVIGVGRKQICFLDHEMSYMEKPTRSHSLNCCNTQRSLMLSIVCQRVKSMTHEVPFLLGRPANAVALKFLPSVTPEHTARLEAYRNILHF